MTGLILVLAKIYKVLTGGNPSYAYIFYSGSTIHILFVKRWIFSIVADPFELSGYGITYTLEQHC